MIEVALEADELPAAVADNIASWRRTVSKARPEMQRDILRNAAADLSRTRRVCGADRPDLDAVMNQIIVDSLAEMADGAQIDPDDALALIAEGISAADLVEISTISPSNPSEEYGSSPPTAPDGPFVPPPLTIEQWLSRDLAPPDFLLGNWLTTTSRALLSAATGLGKTNFAMALGMHASAGADFLHWQGRRPCNVLYIDGEMSRRLFRQRLQDAVERLGTKPAGFHAFSHEDGEGKFAPLNTLAGQRYIENIISQIGKPDLIQFDSIMCLIEGDMKDGEGWARVMPWLRSLTARQIGQMWLHHTGHDESRSYGDKTKEWQLDTVAHATAVARDAVDVSFDLEFRKARERTPSTRADFQTARVCLMGNQWTTEATGVLRRGHVTPLGLKFFAALQNVLASDVTSTRLGRRTATLEQWRRECIATGLLRGRTTGSQHRPGPFLKTSPRADRRQPRQLRRGYGMAGFMSVDYPNPRVLAAGVRTYDELREAIDRRAAQLGVTRAWIDFQAGIADGLSGKILSPRPSKKLGNKTLPWILDALGLVIDVRIVADKTDAHDNPHERAPHWRTIKGSGWGRRMVARRYLKQSAAERKASARKAARICWSRQRGILEPGS